MLVKEFAEKMEKNRYYFIAIKREHMIKSNKKAEYFFKLKKKIKILLDNFGLRFIKAISRDPVVEITL